MKHTSTITTCKKSQSINRTVYFLYMVLVIYLLIMGDYELAFTNMGIALVFEPFDPSIKWRDKPRYQKAWLLCNLILFFAGFAFIIFR